LILWEIALSKSGLVYQTITNPILKPVNNQINEFNNSPELPEQFMNGKFDGDIPHTIELRNTNPLPIGQRTMTSQFFYIGTRPEQLLLPGWFTDLLTSPGLDHYCIC
jgi:hypothetical protein